MKTKPRGVWANFTTECAKCAGELTVTNGRVDSHTCRVDLTIYAEHADVEDAREIRTEIMRRLDAALDNR